MISDVVKVAPFAVHATGESIDELVIDCGADDYSASYDFVVMNKSHGVASGVSFAYTVELVLGEKLPSGITVTLDGMSGQKMSDGLSYRFANADWYFGVNDTDEHQHTLVFVVDANNIALDVSISDIHINIIAEQID